MQLYLSAIVSGIAVGGIYALVAVGITQIFTVTRVLNFAHAGFMMWGAYIYALLTHSKHWPVWFAAAATMVLIGVMGLLAELLIFRYASKATTVNKIIMTFGLLNALTALAAMVFTRDTKAAHALFPRGGFSVFGTSISWQQFANLMSVVAVIVLMNLFLRRTRLGLQTRAMADNITMAELMGASRSKIGMLNWTMSAMIGGLAGVLLASLAPFALPQFTAVFLFALVATLLGGLRSLSLTALGGLILGVIVSISTVASNRIGTGTLAIFITVVALVVLRKKWPSELSKIGWTRPQLSNGRKDWLINRIIVVGSWIGVIWAATRSDVWGFTGATIMVYTVCALSLIPLVGWTGQISLAQGGFMAIGAAAYNEANSYHHLSIGLSLVIALAVGAIVGGLVGLICFRLSFVQTAIITISFTGLVVGWFVYSPWIHVSNGRFSVDTPNFMDTGKSAFVVFSVVAILCGLALRNIKNTQWGTAFISVRTAPDMARHFGQRPAFVRIAAFSLSSTLAALAGVMYITMLTITESSQFGIGFALQIFIFTVAGGTSSIWGPFIGPMAFLSFPLAFNLAKYGGSGWPDLLGGVGIIQFMATAPDGMMSLLRRPGRAPKKQTPPASDAVPVATMRQRRARKLQPAESS